MTVQTYIEKLIGREGAYSNNPDDAGGETMWGVTAAVARAYGYRGEMRSMPREAAVQIYIQRYWTVPRLDQIEAVFPALAEEMLDTGVNAGPATAVKFLQRALNVLNRQAKAWPDIAVDGGVGPLTVAALRAFLAERGEDGKRTLMAMMNAQQSVYYIEIAERRPANETFMFGWQFNRVLNPA